MRAELVTGMSGIKVGFHVSIAGGISNSVDNANKLGCTAFQIFSRNPRGWAAKALDATDVKLFKDRLSQSEIAQNSVVVHMPYLPNLSGPPGEFYEKSTRTLTEEVQRCMALGIPNLVIHLGSHLGKGSAQGISQLTSAIDGALASAEKTGMQNRVIVLLENNAGQKNAVGANFEELRTILDKIADRRHVGVCLDTCHLFASGYDIRTSDGVNSTLEKFDKIVGLRELHVIHLNDSKGELNSNLDRHQHIGLGQIGLKGVSAILNHKATRHLPFIMETPIDDERGDKENMKAVARLAK